MGNFTRREFFAALSAFPLLLPKTFGSHQALRHLLDGAGRRITVNVSSTASCQCLEAGRFLNSRLRIDLGAARGGEHLPRDHVLVRRVLTGPDVPEDKSRTFFP